MLRGSCAAYSSLVLTVLSDQMLVSRFTFACLPKLFFHVDFEIRFGDVRNGISTRPLVLSSKITSLVREPNDTAAKVALVLRSASAS